ncbi:MAG: MlrC C-terminal domain-containing protein, partial [Anaerolineae bacterium]|nr:MlrC C-terminal domain-containing protein [Anaerolineae bacterium]
LDGYAKPVTARVAIPVLVRGDELITETGLFGRVVHSAMSVEHSMGGLSAGMMIGNPFTDVPDLCSNSLVVTDDDPARALDEAMRLALDFWTVRHHLQAKLVSLDEMAAIAQQTLGQGTAILTDAADATSSGASGDSNAILRALLDTAYQGRLLLPLVDPGAVESAFRSGVGATVQTTVGGALDPAHFTPLPITARVKMLSDVSFPSESHGTIWNAGNTAVLEMENVVMVVTSRPVSLYDRSLFLAHGQNPKHFDAVVVKSPHCQPRFYADWGACVVNVDAPGSSSANLPYLGHTRCRRPIFPLDGDVPFEPVARLFRRG